MQSTKDTFYAALRDRLARIDPQRTIIVAENVPATTAPAPLDSFIIHWSAPNIVQAVAANQALWRMDCRIAYSTSGADPASTDRARSIAALTYQLVAITTPRNAPKRDYTSTPAADLGTNIFWSDPRFSDAAPASSALTRAADFTVYFFSEVTA